MAILQNQTKNRAVWKLE